MKLKLHLAQYMNTVEMRVLEQEGISENLSDRVQIKYAPALFEEYICLRGMRTREDNTIVSIGFNTEVQASEYLTKVIGWLDDIFHPYYEEITKGDKVATDVTNNTVFFLADLGEGVCEGRYLTAERFENGKYTHLACWKDIIRVKQSGHWPNTKKYYGEINETKTTLSTI